MSIVLAIDTASDAFALALDIDGELTVSSSAAIGRETTRLLLPAIEALLGGRRTALTGIVVVTGPGSYAGLRSGIATAEGLGLALAVKIAGVPTLEAVAFAANVRDGLVIHPAGRGQFALQSVANGELLQPPILVPGEELPAGVAGEGAAAFGGVEVSPGARVRAALHLGLDRLANDAPDGGVEDIYLKEPHITVSRRIKTALAIGGEQ